MGKETITDERKGVGNSKMGNKWSHSSRLTTVEKSENKMFELE